MSAWLASLSAGIAGAAGSRFADWLHGPPAQEDCLGRAISAFVIAVVLWVIAAAIAPTKPARKA